MPATRCALRAGEVSMSAARVLARVRQVDPDAFDEDEAQLVEAARVHSRRGFVFELVDGTPVFRRPDGSVLDRAPVSGGIAAAAGDRGG